MGACKRKGDRRDIAAEEVIRKLGEEKNCG